MGDGTLVIDWDEFKKRWFRCVKCPFGVTIVFREDQKHIMELLDLKDLRYPTMNNDTFRAEMEAGVPLRFHSRVFDWIDKETGICIIGSKIQEVARLEIRGERSLIVYDVFVDSYGHIVGFVDTKYVRQIILD